MTAFRAGVAGDAPAIAALIASFHPLITVHPDGTGAEQYFASVSEASERGYLESPRHAYLVAEEGGTLAGFVALRDNAHLFHLFVARAHQRRGLARRLWDRARAQALQRGNPGRFTVNASLNAVAVYERFGFVPRGEVTESHGIRFLPMQWGDDGH